MQNFTKAFVFFGALGAIVAAPPNLSAQTEAGERARMRDEIPGRQMQEQRQGAGQSQVSQEGRQFLKETAQNNLAEKELSELAARKASDEEVKELAETLAKDHQQEQQKLEQVAQNVNVELPKQLESKQKQTIEEMQKLSGEEFDQRYVTHVIQQHQKTVNKFQQQAKSAQNQQVKQFAENQLPMLKQHLEKAKEVQKSVGTA